MQGTNTKSIIKKFDKSGFYCAMIAISRDVDLLLYDEAMKKKIFDLLPNDITNVYIIDEYALYFLGRGSTKIRMMEFKSSNKKLVDWLNQFRSFALLKFSQDEISRLKDHTKKAMLAGNNLDEQLIQKIQDISLKEADWTKIKFRGDEVKRLKEFLDKNGEASLSAKLLLFIELDARKIAKEKFSLLKLLEEEECEPMNDLRLSQLSIGEMHIQVQKEIARYQQLQLEKSQQWHKLSEEKTKLNKHLFKVRQHIQTKKELAKKELTWATIQYAYLQYRLQKNQQYIETHENKSGIGSEDYRQHFPVHQAIYANNFQLLKNMLHQDPKLLNQPDEKKFTPLHYAACYGQKDAIDLLLEKGADYHVLNCNGETAIDLDITPTKCISQYASKKTYANLLGIINRYEKDRKHTVPTFKKALQGSQQNRVNLNVVDDYGYTLLHHAVQKALPTMVALLIDQTDIDLTIKNKSGYTALQMAQSLYKREKDQNKKELFTQIENQIKNKFKEPESASYNIKV